MKHNFKVGEFITIKKGTTGLNSAECLDNRVCRIDEIKANGSVFLVNFFKSVKGLCELNEDILDSQRYIGIEDIEPLTKYKLKKLLEV